MIRVILFLLTFCFFGCGVKQYDENKIYGKGLNAGVKYDTIKNDAYLIEKLEEYHYDFFQYNLNYAETKIKEILEDKKIYSAKQIQINNLKKAKEYKVDGSSYKTDVFNEIVKDYNYNE